MKLLKKGCRSSIYKDGEDVFRLYHDTSDWVKLPVHLDARGTRRYEQNCTEQGLCRSCSSLPAYLRKAREAVLSSTTIQQVAEACDVKTTTAWNYTTKLCEDATVAIHVLETEFICAELKDAASDVDLGGPLRSVMERIEDSIRDVTEWRCEHDRFSQLRLFRVCLTSVRQSRVLG